MNLKIILGVVAISEVVLASSILWLMTLIRSEGAMIVTSESDVHMQERLRAHQRIMTQIIELNRKCVTMDEREFQEQMDHLVTANEGELTQPYEEVVATYQASFYIISPIVKDAVSDYLDYFKTYHSDGVNIKPILSNSGTVVSAMRTDSKIESIFPEQH